MNDVLVADVVWWWLNFLIGLQRQHHTANYTGTHTDEKKKTGRMGVDAVNTLKEMITIS